MQFARAIGLTAVLGLAWASSLSAQRGAGHAGVAGPSFAPGFQRGVNAPSPRVAQAPSLNLGGRPYPIRGDIPTPIGLNAPAASYTGILPGALKSINGGRGSRHYPGFIAPPLFFPTYVDPFYSSFGGYNDAAAPPVDPNAQAFAESQNALAQQVEQLASQIQEMKNSNAQPPAPDPAPSVSAAPERRPPTPPVTLVLRDGQQMSVESYAVMNQMFWNFSRRPVQKIPIANIDIPASTRATEANGGEFPQLTSPQ